MAEIRLTAEVPIVNRRQTQIRIFIAQCEVGIVEVSEKCSKNTDSVSRDLIGLEVKGNYIYRCTVYIRPIFKLSFRSKLILLHATL